MDGILRKLIVACAMIAEITKVARIAAMTVTVTVVMMAAVGVIMVLCQYIYLCQRVYWHH